MLWIQKERLRPVARDEAHRWVKMNTAATEVIVCAVTSKSALIFYEQDRVPFHVFLFIPKGEKDAVFIYDDDAIPEGRRRLRTRVEEALRDWTLIDREAARKQAYERYA